MELKPGYKKTEIGVIPDDWDASTIGDAATLLTGFPFPSSGYSQSGVRLVRGSNVKRGELDWNESITEFWPQVTSDVARYLLRETDVVIAMDGALVGRSYAVICKADLPSLLLQRVARLRSKNCDQHLIAAWIGSPAFERHVDSLKTQTAIPHISPADIRSLGIAVPKDLQEQSAIATALSDVDALLAAQDALIEKKRAIKQGAMQELLTGKRRLPGFDGEWEVRRLGEIAHIKTGSRNNEDKVEDGEYPFFVRSEFVERIDGYSYDCEAILVPGEGKIGEIFHYINGRFDVHQRVYAITRFSPEVSARFVHLYLKMHFGQWAMQNTVKATVDSLRLPTFQNFAMRLPATNEEQVAIANVFGDIEAGITALEAKREKTWLLKQGMMQELLTGKTRLLPPQAAAA